MGEERDMTTERIPSTPLGNLEILRSAIENTNEAFVTIDETHRVIFYNQAAEKVFGFRKEEVLGRDLEIIMLPSCARDHKAAVARYVATRAPHRIGHDTEITATRKGGETFPAAISFSVTEVDGRLFFTAIVRDLTEDHAMRERLLQSERLAALGQMVAEISHEIKNPLMMIGGFARQLLEGLSEEKARKKLTIILHEVERLETLLMDLRILTVPRSRGRGPLDMRLLLREVHTLMREECLAKGIALHLTEGQETLLVGADGDKLKQVLLNVARNAMEAMPRGGTLHLEGSRSGREIRIALRDTGTGIPEAALKKLFTPFYTTKAQGTGLGLCVSKKIIEEHSGGHFLLESEEGRGTTVTILLPAYEGDP